RGRRLGDEGEGAVRVRGDHGRNRQARLHLLRGGVERLAEFHDVQAALAQRGTDGRAGIGLPGLDLQLEVTDDFLCHFIDSSGSSACTSLRTAGLPAWLNSGMGNGEWGMVRSKSASYDSRFPIPDSRPSGLLHLAELEFDRR